MSKPQHPYPKHVMEAVARAVLNYYEQLDGLDMAAVEIADVALQALWDASRVDTVEQLAQLSDDYYIIDANGYWGDKSNYMQNDDPSEFPIRVIYWGESDE